MRAGDYYRGVALVLIGGLFLSMNGIALRLLDDADGWQVLFYRGIAFTTALFLFLLLKYRGRTLQAFASIGPKGYMAALAIGLAACFYVFSLLLTTVANAMFIIGSAPLVTAAAAWVFLNEKTSTVGIIAMLAALGGVALLFVDGYSSGNLAGIFAALAMVACFVTYLLIVRDQRDIDMLPAICLSGLVMVVGGFMGATDLSVSARDLGIAIFMGAVLVGVGFACYTVAAKYLMASEVALYALCESVFAPVWVWIGVGEVPGSFTLVGSLVIVLAVVTYSLIEIAQERRQRVD